MNGALIYFMFFLLILPFCLAEQNQTKGTYKIEELIFDVKLNFDESIDFSETFGISYDFPESFFLNEKMMMNFSIPLPDIEMHPNFKIVDTLNHVEFTRVYFFEKECENTFIYNDKNNQLYFCLKPKRQARIEISGMFFSKRNVTSYEFCSSNDLTGNIIGNQFSLNFPPANYSYPVLIIQRGGNEVRIRNDKLTTDPCNSTSNHLTIKSVPIKNGAICVGDILPSKDGSILTMDFTLRGENQNAINQKKQEEYENLTKQNIESSIKASDAAIETSNATTLNVYLTFALVLLTFVNIFKKETSSFFKKWIFPLFKKDSIKKLLNIK